MSDIKNKDRILEAIDQLRRRKARPDIERICNFLLRRFSVDSRDTIADLGRLVDAEIVIKVEYKGNTSYRNAAKWSRLAVHHKNKESVGENNNLPDARSLLSRAFASLLVEDPDYLDFGVPGNELKRVLLEDDPCTELTDLDVVLQRELNSGYLVKLENGNYSLADHPVPSSSIKHNSNNNGDMQIFKVESPSPSLYQALSNNSLSRQPENNIKNASKATDVNNRRNIKIEDMKSSFADTATGAINIGGFRVGVRRKRAKKVFDPSDNNIPTRKRGRPLGSTKSKEGAQSNNKGESAGVCLICHHHNNRRGQFEKLISCRNCSNKVHPSCLDAGDRGLQTLHWQCIHCKVCAHCYESAGSETMVVCSECGDNYHASCHMPRVPDRARGSKWSCYRCVPKTKPTAAHTVISTSYLSVPHESPVPDSMAASFPASAMRDCEDQIDERIPDASEWSVEQVSNYLAEQGYPEQAEVFKSNEIDGASLLLMKRNDVLLGMQMKLGPALKIYGQVKRLQIRQSDPRLLWA